MKKKMPKPEVMSERQTRDKIMFHAIKLGCDIEVRALFRKYDNLLKSCTNESERKHISALAITEIYNLVGFRGGLTINDEVVIPGEEPPEPERILDANGRPITPDQQ